MTRLSNTLTVLAGIALLLAVAACAWRGLQTEGGGARRLYIVGDLAHISDRRVAEAAQPYLQAGFFELDIDAIRNDVAALPWVAAASVHRRWPDGVVVRLREHHAVARWGDDAMLAADGTVFTLGGGKRPPDLPRLSGPDGSSGRVLERLSRLQPLLEPADRRITALALDARGAWQICLDGGLVLRLGRANLDERLQRFVSHLSPALNRRLEDAGYVDLRYADGFAVGGTRTHSEQKDRGEADHGQTA